MFDTIIAWLVRTSLRTPILVVALALALSLAAGVYTARHISIDTDATKLLSAELPWRKREATFDAAFPQNIDLLAIVIDGATPELAERATALLTEHLRARTDLFRTVRRPDGGPFFDRNGLLYLPLDEVQATTEQIVAAQPLLGPLSADPTLRGLFGALSTFVDGITRGAAGLMYWKNRWVKLLVRWTPPPMARSVRHPGARCLPIRHPGRRNYGGLF